MSRSPRLAAAVVAAGLLAGCASGGATEVGVQVNGSSSWRGTHVPDGYPLPEVPFTDTTGARTSLAEQDRTPVTLVFFGYTSCPDICNIVLANVASALRGSKQRVRDDVRLVFVSTDPRRDTPEVVRRYLDQFDPGFAGLVGPETDVASAAKALYISYERPDGSTGGAYEVDHGTYTTGFADGRAEVVWSDTTSVADLRADLARLARLA